MARGLYIGGKIVWSTIPEINLLTGTAESIDLSAYLYNPRNRAITYSAVGSLPTGCSISGNYLDWNGNGTPFVTSATIRAASNQYQVDVSASIDVALGGNSPPEWSQYIGPFTVPEGAAIGTVVATMSAYVSDPEDDTLTITMNGTLPSGLSYDSGTTEVTVTGALTAGNTANVTFNADDAYVEQAITTLTLSGGSAGKAWTFGHPFKQGDVPSGQYIAATGPTSFQADIRNRWSDGSVKFAVLSGVGGTSAELRSTTTAPSGSNVAEPSTTATVQFSSPATTVSLATARANGSMTWAKATAHKVREILGPVMSEFHYYSPVSGDNHLAVWWYVRAYVSGAVEVETVIENGWVLVTSPGLKSYTATVTVGGVEKFSGSISHAHHARWSRADWAGTDPGLTPVHDVEYLRSTSQVLNYGTSVTPTATFEVTAQLPVPFALGDHTDAMGTTGDHPTIGPLPQWESVFCASGTSNAYVATVGNARLYGAYGIHYRDEATGLPVNMNSAEWESLSINNAYSGIGNNAGNGDIITPAPTGGEPRYYKYSHHPSAGFLAYLLTGRWVFMEEQQFCAMTFPMTRGPYAEGVNGFILDDQQREGAWAMRTYGQAASVTPDDHPLYQAFRNFIAYNVSDRITRFVSVGQPSPLGVWGYGSDYAGSPHYNMATWQLNFGVVVFKWLNGLDVNANLPTLLTHVYKHPVQFCGTSAGWHYVHSPAYSAPYCPDSDWNGWYTAPEAYGYFLTQRGYSVPATDNPGQALILDDAPVSVGEVLYGYSGAMRAALVCAKDAGASGADAAYALLNSSVSFSNVSSQQYANDPRWKIDPR